MKLVYFEAHPTRQQALKREQQIKKAGRTYKQMLIKRFRINLDHFKEDLLRIPVKASTQSGGSRPCVPVQAVHPIGAKRRWPVYPSVLAWSVVFFRLMDAPLRVIL